MVKQMGTGLLLALQFFSVIPVKKQLPMEKNSVTSMYVALPFLGAVFGVTTAVMLFFMRNFTDSSPLLMAFIAVLIGVVLTGGLHMDGLADVGDAYFSFQDRKKRLEIMGDPRIGAFGAMVLFFAITGKIIMVAEMIETIPLTLIVVVPVFSRIALLLLFTWTKSAKDTGLAAFFQQRTQHRTIVFAAFVYLLITAVAVVYSVDLWFAAGLIGILALAFYSCRKWCLRHFGGVTGDLFGAVVEGAELLLWTIFLFFI